MRKCVLMFILYITFIGYWPINTLMLLVWGRKQARHLRTPVQKVAVCKVGLRRNIEEEEDDDEEEGEEEGRAPCFRLFSNKLTFEKEVAVKWGTISFARHLTITIWAIPSEHFRKVQKSHLIKLFYPPPWSCFPARLADSQVDVGCWFLNWRQRDEPLENVRENQILWSPAALNDMIDNRVNIWTIKKWWIHLNCHFDTKNIKTGNRWRIR